MGPEGVHPLHGLPRRSAHTHRQEQLKRKPFALVEDAVRGMPPKNSLGREMFRNLHVYVGPDHKHEAQQPEQIKFA